MSANITTNQTAHSDMNTMAGFVKTFVEGKVSRYRSRNGPGN